MVTILLTYIRQTIIWNAPNKTK